MFALTQQDADVVITVFSIICSFFLFFLSFPSHSHFFTASGWAEQQKQEQH